MKIAILGSGIMGAPMARNLAKAGHEVRAWNRTVEKARPLEADGIHVFGDAREAVRGVEVVVTMLTDGDAVRAVLDDTGGGALLAMDDGAVLCQMSTIGIAALEQVALLCERRGVPLVDAPVLGTRQPAEEGKLVVLASGPRDAVQRCTPIFEAVGAKTIDCGDTGGGTRLKLVANHWLLVLVDGVAETIQLAEGLDADPAKFLDAIRGGPLDSAYADVKGKQMLEHAFVPPSFPLKHAGKDGRLVLEADERHAIGLELMPVIERRIERAVKAGHGDEDLAAIFEA
jgi:3-hydroxyisobutyrate dehydrogenase